LSSCPAGQAKQDAWVPTPAAGQSLPSVSRARASARASCPSVSAAAQAACAAHPEPVSEQGFAFLMRHCVGSIQQRENSTKN